MFNSFPTRNNKKEICFGLAFLLLLFFLFLPSPTLAFWETLKNAIIALPALTINFILILVIYLTYALAWITGAILDIAMSPSLIALSYTNPAGNQVIKAGLSITQNFVNMLLVVALVYTALSLALRLNETQAKKMLARLIVVALLANFAPVFCGLIVDAANIVMYYFLEPIQAGASGILLQMDAGKVISMIKSAGLKASEQLGVLGAVVSQIILNIGVGIVFFLFAGIFLVRYIAIWTLVILAPIAFVAWVFPTGRIRSFWNMWLNQFIEWSIIGIPIAFFLYLAVGAFSIMTAAFKLKMEVPGLGQDAGFLGEIFPYFVIIVFLFLGFTLGLETGAMGASATISYTKKAGERGARFAGRVGKFGARKAVGRKGRAWLEKQAAARFMPQKIAEMKGIKGLLAKTAYTLTLGAPVGSIWALRRGIGEASLRILEAERKGIKSAEEKAKGTTAERKASVITSGIAPVENRIGYLRQAIEEGQISDLKKAGVRDSDIIKLGRAALTIHPEEFAKIRDAFPHLAEQIGKGFSEEVKREAGLTFKDNAEEDQFNKSIASKIVARMKPSKIPQMDWQSAFNADPFIEEAVHRFWNPEQLSTALKNFGTDFAQRFQSGAQQLGREWYQTNNPLLAKYLTTDAANSLGVGFEKLKPAEEKPAEEKKIIPPREEEFRKARKKYGPGAFG